MPLYTCGTWRDALHVPMAGHLLPNYLRSFRKRTGLSQPDIAYLLGAEDGGCVSRYENFRIKPSLRTALVFVILFRTSVRELFKGDYQKLERVIFNRAKRLGDRIAKESQTSLTARKLASLMDLMSDLSRDDAS